MKLTDELFEKGKDSKKICTILDDEYVLLTKFMPVVDKELDDYLDKIKRAHEAGVSIAYVEDYRLIEGTTCSFDNGKSYTKGVFLEKRAKGNILDSIYCSSLYESSDANEILEEYIEKNTIYLEELEKRAQGSDEVYEKLVRDYLKIEEFGLEVDPKPLNFFYDEKEGFTLIDPITKGGGDLREFYPSYIIGAVYGYGRLHIFLDLERGYLGLPKELTDRFNKVYEIINKKIMMALRKNGIDEKNIISCFQKDTFKTICQERTMEKEELLNILNNLIENKKQIG